MRDFIATSKALSDPARVRVLVALHGGELCLCQMIDLLGLAPSTVSKHVTLLQQAGLVERRKKGRWHFYRLSDDKDAPMTREALKWAIRSVKDTKLIKRDAAAVRLIRKKDLDELSACYKVGKR